MVFSRLPETLSDALILLFGDPKTTLVCTDTCFRVP